MSLGKKTGYLVMQPEDNFFVAYLTNIDDPEDSIKLGSLHMSFIQDDTLREQFIKLIKGSVDYMHQRIGVSSAWGEMTIVDDAPKGGVQ